MFLEEEPSGFFPGASSSDRTRTSSGGQQFRMNPLGGPPIMHTRIEPTADGIASTYTGLVKGGAHLRITQQGDVTVIEETTDVLPNLGALPGVSLLERVPLLGAFPRMMRMGAETVIGAALASVHAGLVARDGGQRIAQTLQRRAASSSD